MASQKRECHTVTRYWGLLLWCEDWHQRKAGYSDFGIGRVLDVSWIATTSPAATFRASRAR